MSKDHFHYATVGFKELRNELLSSNKDIESLKGDVYLAEMGQHPELKFFFDSLSQNKGPISTKERTEFFQSLVSSVVVSSPVSRNDFPDLLKYPPSEKSLAFLEEARDRNPGLRELASIAAHGALLLTDETKSREQIFAGVNAKYATFLVDVNHQLGSVVTRY
jgi:hypothetical protein